MLWVLIGLGVVVLLVMALAVVNHIGNRQIREWEGRIRDGGERLLCWVASAEDSLYEVHDVPGYGNARVVFSPNAPPELKKRLKDAARRLSKGDIVDQDMDPDLIDPFYEKVKAQRWLHPPLRLPRWLVGDFKVYTSMVHVYWRRLPDLCLTRPYLYCWVLFDAEGGVTMAKYRDEDDD